MTIRKQSNLLREVTAIDPDYQRDSRVVIEYQFGNRIFKGDYQTRGPYAEEEE